MDVTETRWPDLLIGLLIAAFAVRGGGHFHPSSAALRQRPCVDRAGASDLHLATEPDHAAVGQAEVVGDAAGVARQDGE